MHKNLSKYSKLLVISDTGIFTTDKGYMAFGPVVKELEHLLDIFDEITWIGFEKISEKSNLSYIPIVSDRIHPILLKEVGGNSLKDKLDILKHYPLMYKLIFKEIRDHAFIHSRAPSNPAFIAMLLSLFFGKKKFWFKYAGTWIDDASFFYKFQREFLKLLNKNTIVTINGNYSNKKRILSFENPCLDSKDRILGKKIIESKKLSQKRVFCFVGALNRHKGVHLILEALSMIKDYSAIDTFHFIGDGPERIIFEEMAREIPINIVFHGFLPKDQINKIYENSHFILLPSKSEGFPKVIGEAMNFGCIPIVSNVSCLGDYIQIHENGYLLESLNPKVLQNKIEFSLKLGSQQFKYWTAKNYALAAKFTYTYYNQRIVSEIFN